MFSFFILNKWLSRQQLFEIHDLESTPVWLRHMVTEVLVLFWGLLWYYDSVSDVLSPALKETNSNVVIDLCVGSGGPLPRIQRSLAGRGHEFTVVLTDLVPHPASYKVIASEAKNRGQIVQFREEPVDATACREKGFRTLFGSFHHFPPSLAVQVLQNAVDTGSPIAIFEATERSWYNLLLIFNVFLPIMTTLLSIILSPWHVFFCWAIPALPIVMWFDGMVSCLRTYSPSEFHSLVAQVKGHESFEWEAGVKKLFLAPSLVYYIGKPKRVKKSQIPVSQAMPLK